MGDNKRVKIQIKDVTLQSGLMSNGDMYTIYFKKELAQKLGLEEDDEVDITIEKDHSEYGLPMPESFEVLLDQDDEGRQYFKALTMGKQRSLVYIVSKVKNVDSQLAKGLAILHHLKEANGKLDFKRLNEVIKIYNNMKQ